MLRRHLVEKMPVSNVCNQPGINPTLCYRWQKDLFENGAAVFGRRRDDGQHRRLLTLCRHAGSRTPCET